MAANGDNPGVIILPPVLRVLAIAAALAVAFDALGESSITVTRQDKVQVAMTVYSPAGECRGTAIISHGAGGSEQGYSYLGKYFAGEGWLAIVPGHRESGLKALRDHMHGANVREGLGDLVTDPAAYQGRLMDIKAARLWAKDHCKAAAAILVGHSMGAATVMIEAGAKNNLGVKGSDAFDAYIALSPQGHGSIFPADAWKAISKPVLTITGTNDGELGGESWRVRTEPFANMAPGCKWLGVVDGATHMNFAGRGSASAETLTLQTIGAFLAAQGHGCKAPQVARGIEVQVK
jgi:predicted dienelactone hydrolase